jgi:hypothetical protein
MLPRLLTRNGKRRKRSHGRTSSLHSKPQLLLITLPQTKVHSLPIRVKPRLTWRTRELLSRMPWIPSKEHGTPMRVRE